MNLLDYHPSFARYTFYIREDFPQLVLPHYLCTQKLIMLSSLTFKEICPQKFVHSFIILHKPHLQGVLMFLVLHPTSKVPYFPTTTHKNLLNTLRSFTSSPHQSLGEVTTS